MMAILAAWFDIAAALVFGWFSVATLIGFAALAVAIFLPKPLDWITDLRKWAIVVAVCAFGFAGLSAHYYALGLDTKQAQWDAARVAADAAKAAQERVIAAHAAAQERAQIADERAADIESIEELNRYVATLQDRCKGDDGLTDADLRWLRNN